MESKQFELCLAVLRRLHQAGVLPHLVLIGSWCLYPYREYFRAVGEVYPVKTRDMDFLVPTSGAFRSKVSVPDLLKDLGFITGFRGDKGHIFLQHPELMVEFLVPEHGRGSAGVKKLPALGMNAQALRFMDVALEKTVRLSFEDVPVVVPHPAAFAIHKLLVAPRRKNAEKKRKDIDTALAVLDLIEKKGEIDRVKEFLPRFPRTWRNTVLSMLRKEGREELAERLGATGLPIKE